MAACRPPFETRASLCSGPPVPVSASTVIGATNVTTIVFDCELSPDTLDDTQWSGRIDDHTQISLSAEAVGNTVIWTSEEGANNAGPDLVSYDDTAGDVRARFGQFSAASFTDFPIT